MSRFICDRCGMTIPPHAHYIVKMEIYADPSLPAVSSDDPEETDYAQRTADLLREMQGMSAQELEDAVYFRREFKVCRPCQVGLLKNPLGAEESGSSPEAPNQS